MSDIPVCLTRPEYPDERDFPFGKWTRDGPLFQSPTFFSLRFSAMSFARDKTFFGSFLGSKQSFADYPQQYIYRVNPRAPPAQSTDLPTVSPFMRSSAPGITPAVLLRVRWSQFMDGLRQTPFVAVNVHSRKSISRDRQPTGFIVILEHHRTGIRSGSYALFKNYIHVGRMLV